MQKNHTRLPPSQRSEPLSISALNETAVALASASKFTEALGLFDRALKLDPRHASSHHNRGAVQTMQGDLRSAVESYRLALELDPHSAKAHFNLANIHRRLGNTEQAVKHLTHTIEIDPGHHSAPHILATTQGRTTESAPVEYVRQLFDQYAATFESVLTTTLDYQTPRLLRDLLVTRIEPGLRFAQALDLGCGTGLAGLEFQSRCEAISGVDVSGGMIEKAREKAIYSSLHRAEMVEYLRRSAEQFDLFIAADSLIYLGNLAPLFREIAARATPNAYLTCSVEHASEADYVLTSSGRYAHSIGYLHAVAVEYGMTVVVHTQTVLRKEVGQDVHGTLLVLEVASTASRQAN